MSYDKLCTVIFNVYNFSDAMIVYVKFLFLPENICSTIDYYCSTDF